MAIKGSSLRIGGLNSGLDTESIVNAMTASTKLRITTNQRKVLQLQAQQAAYRTIIDKFQGFKDKYFNSLNQSTWLRSTSSFSKFSTTISQNGVVSTPAGLSVVAGSNAQAGTYTVTVNSTATQTTLTSKATDTLTSAFDPSKYNDPNATYAMSITVGGDTKVIGFEGGTSAQVLESINKALVAAYGKANDTDNSTSVNFGRGMVYAVANSDGTLKFESREKKAISTSAVTELKLTEELKNFANTNGLNSVTLVIGGQSVNVGFHTVKNDYFDQIKDLVSFNDKGEMILDSSATSAQRQIFDTMKDVLTDMYKNALQGSYNDWKDDSVHDVTGGYNGDFKTITLTADERAAALTSHGFGGIQTIKGSMTDAQYEAAKNKEIDDFLTSLLAPKTAAENAIRSINTADAKRNALLALNPSASAALDFSGINTTDMTSSQIEAAKNKIINDYISSLGGNYEAAVSAVETAHLNKIKNSMSQEQVDLFNQEVARRNAAFLQSDYEAAIMKAYEAFDKWQRENGIPMTIPNPNHNPNIPSNNNQALTVEEKAAVLGAAVEAAVANIKESDYSSAALFEAARQAEIDRIFSTLTDTEKAIALGLNINAIKDSHLDTAAFEAAKLTKIQEIYDALTDEGKAAALGINADVIKSLYEANHEAAKTTELDNLFNALPDNDKAAALGLDLDEIRKPFVTAYENAKHTEVLSQLDALGLSLHVKATALGINFNDLGINPFDTAGQQAYLDSYLAAMSADDIEAAFGLDLSLVAFDNAGYDAALQTEITNAYNALISSGTADEWAVALGLDISGAPGFDTAAYTADLQAAIVAAESALPAAADARAAALGFDLSAMDARDYLLSAYDADLQAQVDAAWLAMSGATSSVRAQALNFNLSHILASDHTAAKAAAAAKNKVIEDHLDSLGAKGTAARDATEEALADAAAAKRNPTTITNPDYVWMTNEWRVAMGFATTDGTYDADGVLNITAVDGASYNWNADSNGVLTGVDWTALEVMLGKTLDTAGRAAISKVMTDAHTKAANSQVNELTFIRGGYNEETAYNTRYGNTQSQNDFIKDYIDNWKDIGDPLFDPQYSSANLAEYFNTSTVNNVLNNVTFADGTKVEAELVGDIVKLKAYKLTADMQADALKSMGFTGFTGTNPTEVQKQNQINTFLNSLSAADRIDADNLLLAAREYEGIGAFSNTGNDFALATNKTTASVVTSTTKLNELGLTANTDGVTLNADERAAALGIKFNMERGSLNDAQWENAKLTAVNDYLAGLNATQRAAADAALETAVNNKGTYTFDINGVSFTFAGNTTISAMMSTINSNVQANVTMTFSTLTNQFEIKSKDYGNEPSISLGKDSQGVFAALGFTCNGETAVRGSNMSMTITDPNGKTETIETANNSYTVNGVTITANSSVALGEKFIIEVQRDTAELSNMIKEFVKDYNELIGMVYGYINDKADKDYYFLTDYDKDELGLSDRQEQQWEEKALKGILANDPTLTRLMTQMRTSLYGGISIGNGEIFGLFSMGITTSDSWRDNGKLVIDEARLLEALDKNLNLVTQLFTDRDNGLMIKMEGIINGAISTSGSRSQKGVLVAKAGIEKTSSVNDNAIYDQIKRIQDMIARFEDRYQRQQDRYWKIFSNMEQQLGQLNSQSDYLASMFNSGSNK